VFAQNNSPTDADYLLTLKGPSPRNLRILNVSAPAVADGNNFAAAGTLSGSVAPPITEIAPGVGPAGGYLPLSLFGIPAFSGVGDETIVNLNVPAFSFGSETYTRVGMTSNGYAVVGGGTSTDVDFVPQTLPNPARPNNVLAPFWTDLNPGAGGGLRAGVLTDGVDNWLVLDWDGVPTFGTSQTQSFEIWIQLTAEAITYSYGTVTGTGSPDGLTVGAENRDGSSGVNLGFVPAAGNEFVITAGAPTAGGTVTVTYTAQGRRAGSYPLPARLQTSITPGVTTEVVTIQVT
jgi:hypothetical protein